ncbi:MAG: F0F1 ATP synthase subunit epsilon [Candidatus Liptonbacteria bacterium]|nr:F0F1 ATP synthase subunit epsilon [Candidatus Liptonbacteria bacterium]
MKLGIYSLKRALFQGVAGSLNCKTRNGEITVLDGHRPLISVLGAGALKIIDENKKEVYIPISSGFLAVHAGSEVKLIVEEA